MKQPRRNARYKMIVKGDYCLYCGDPAYERDHIQTWRVSSYCVPACSDCNRRLGALSTETLGERLEVLDYRLSRAAAAYEGRDYPTRLEGLTGNLKRYMLDLAAREGHFHERRSWLLKLKGLLGMLRLRDLGDLERERAALQETYNHLIRKMLENHGDTKAEGS